MDIRAAVVVVLLGAAGEVDQAYCFGTQTQMEDVGVDVAEEDGGLVADAEEHVVVAGAAEHCCPAMAQ